MINKFNNAILNFLKTGAAVWFTNICGINQHLSTYEYVKIAQKTSNGYITRKIRDDGIFRTRPSRA
jgi:hypothetical protein